MYLIIGTIICTYILLTIIFDNIYIILFDLWWAVVSYS